MQRTLLILACSFICTTVVAQQYPFVHYTPREGLANNRARFIYQDDKGKLYISTYGGLSIYDGSRFINYNTNNGLAASMVNDIVEMGEDSLWIIPNANKIHCLVKGKLSDFITTDGYTPLINQLARSSDGHYYAAADDGFFRLENRRFVKLEFDSLNRPFPDLVGAVEVDKKFFILANPGYMTPFAQLIVYDPATRKVVAANTDIKVVYLFKPSENELWAATSNGIFRINTREFPNKTISLLPLPERYRIPEKLYASYIYKDRQNNLWVSTDKGTYRISSNGNTTLFTTANGLTTNLQTSIFQDRENNMWFTNEFSGLSKLPNQHLAYFPVFRPGFTATDIWIRPSSDSVWFLDSYRNRVLLVLPDGQSEEYSGKQAVTAGRFIVSDKEYLLTRQGIFIWKGDRNNKSYSLEPVYRDSVDFISATTDKNGNIIAVSNKLVVLIRGKVLTAPLDYFADQVTVDGHGRIWIATRNNKLRCFEIIAAGDNMKLSMRRSFSAVLPAASPRSIAVDQEGNIWIGTRDHGIFRLTFDGPDLLSSKQLTTLNGLSDNFVKQLYCDRDNNMWASTPSGLDKIRSTHNGFLVENITMRNNLYVSISKVQQTKKGSFWILSTNGILTYTAGNSAPADWKPELEFSGRVMDNVRQFPIMSGQELPYFRNTLDFELSAPTYIDEKQTRFSYLLEGSGHENWSEPSANASINLVNLSPGEYTLRAKAIFLHGRYPDAEASFSFVVLPPWWQTWWFRALAVTAALGLVLSAFRFYYKRKLQLQRAMMEKKQAVEKERTRIATDMHDDLGAGLSRIKFLSETIGMKKQQHLPIEEDIDNIRAYSHEMIDKMGEIVWALNEKNDTLSDLLSYTRAYAVEYLAQNGISCHVEEPDDLPERVVNGEFRRNIYLTVKEALHNIVKHADATDVHMTIEITDRLSIRIKDNGKGIADGPTLSVGNGLYNMSARIRGLKGRFEIKNTDGTLIDILVPLNT